MWNWDSASLYDWKVEDLNPWEARAVYFELCIFFGIFVPRPQHVQVSYQGDHRLRVRKVTVLAAIMERRASRGSASCFKQGFSFVFLFLFQVLARSVRNSATNSFMHAQPERVMSAVCAILDARHRPIGRKALRPYV